MLSRLRSEGNTSNKIARSIYVERMSMSNNNFNPACDICLTTSIASMQQQVEQEQKEEELMCKYSPTELEQGWEFKIIRVYFWESFKNFEVVQKLCEEEKKYGWIMLEKFDNQRIRFKRPISVRSLPIQPGSDPYRTSYGMNPWLSTAILVLGGLIGFLGILLLILYTIDRITH